MYVYSWKKIYNALCLNFLLQHLTKEKVLSSRWVWDYFHHLLIEMFQFPISEIFFAFNSFMAVNCYYILKDEKRTLMKSYCAPNCCGQHNMRVT